MGNPHPMQGHNNPPDEYALISEKIQDLYDEAKSWCDGEPVTTDEHEKALTSLMGMIRDAEKEADNLRKKEVKPHDDAKKAIQDKFNKLIGSNKSITGLTVEALNACKMAVEPYRQKKAAEAAEKARIEQEKAREAERIAQEEMRKAKESADLEARERAEALAKKAKEAEKSAKSANKSATTGLGLRTYYRAEITDLNNAIKHFWKLDAKPFEELVQKLADQHANRKGGDLPGIKIHVERKAL